MTVPKFRAWHKPMQRMSEVLAISFERQKVKIKHQRGTTHMTVPFGDVELMQSTGIFDKNSKEIFEDDIVKTTRFFGRADETGGFYEYEKELIGIVKQLEGTWVIDTEKGAVYLWTDIGENEVLGNIWENPELLEDLE